MLDVRSLKLIDAIPLMFLLPFPEFPSFRLKRSFTVADAGRRASRMSGSCLSLRKCEERCADALCRRVSEAAISVRAHQCCSLGVLDYIALVTFVPCLPLRRITRVVSRRTRSLRDAVRRDAVRGDAIRM